MRRFLEWLERFMPWLFCLFRRPATCDIRFSLQGRYPDPEITDLNAFGIRNTAITLHGSALFAGRGITIKDFVQKEPGEIRERLSRHLDERGIKPLKHHLVVLDMEPAEPGDEPGTWRPFHPASLGLFDETTRTRIIEGYRQRVECAREVLPNVKIGLFQIIAPYGKGQYNARFRQRMDGYEHAGSLGMYDQVNYLVPALYPDYTLDDAHDIDTLRNWIEAMTRQGIEGAQRLTRRNGERIPLAPYLHFWVQGKHREPRPAVLPEIIRLQLNVLQEYPSVKIIVFWSGRETKSDMVAEPNAVEAIDIHTYLTKVGVLPLTCC